MENSKGLWIILSEFESKWIPIILSMCNTMLNLTICKWVSYDLHAYIKHTRRDLNSLFNV